MARIWHPNVPGMIIFRLFCRILGLSGWSYGREFGPWEVLWYFNSQWQFFGLIKKKQIFIRLSFAAGSNVFHGNFMWRLAG
jgi:hypothetical protein